jgi:AraC-like DNA-binding protein
MVESLCSYVVRLADAHAVSVGDLVGRELSASGEKPLVKLGRFMQQHRAGSHGFHARANAINGFGEAPRMWIDTIERATFQNRLRFLTLLPFRGLFSRQGVPRGARAWCPACYEEQREHGEVIYDPLLWTVALVTACPHHLARLADECPHCRRKSLPLAVYSRPGHCSHCQEWLGKPTESADRHKPNPEPVPVAEFARVQATGDLIRIAPALDGIALHCVWTANLKACIDAVVNGNLGAFAKICRISRSPLTLYLDGRGLPSLDTMLRISGNLGIPITAFLEVEPEKAVAQWEAARQNVAGTVPVVKSRPIEEVRLALQQAVAERPSPSLTEIARRLGYKGAERLYQVDRDLCKQLTANYRRSGRSHGWRKKGGTTICAQVDLQMMLEESLALDEPVSPHHIAARVGYANDGYLQRTFPELCRAIRRKIAALEAQRRVAMERLLTAALNEEPPPTLNDLRSRLGCSSSECLQLHFPGLCKQLLARKQEAREKRTTELKRAFDALLLEEPAVSLSEVSRRLGLSRTHLEDICPEECAAVTSRSFRWRQETSARRKAQLLGEVREVVEQIHARGQYPTLPRVTALLPSTASREWHALTAAVKAARVAIGL